MTPSLKLSPPRLLIIGGGDIAWRALPHLLARYRVYAILRSAARVQQWRSAGVRVFHLDLDRLPPCHVSHPSHRLFRLGFHKILHTAPPPADGLVDTRSQHIIRRLKMRPMVSQQIVIISTTGVYGSTHGTWVNETTPPNPKTPRSQQRLHAEHLWRHFAQQFSAHLTILRAGGIYALDRLPQTRIQSGLPSYLPEEDSFCNLIHANDLASLCVRALERRGGTRVFNAVDGYPIRYGDYLDLVADYLDIPRLPRVSRAELISTLSAHSLAFLNESRRITAHRLYHELHYRPRSPNVVQSLAIRTPDE